MSQTSNMDPAVQTMGIALNKLREEVQHLKARNKIVNLDTIAIKSVDLDGIPLIVPLSQFLSDQGRKAGLRTPQDYEIKKLKDWFFDCAMESSSNYGYKLGDDIQVLNHQGLELIANERSQWTMHLTRALAGCVELPVDPDSDLPCIELLNPGYDYSQVQSKTRGRAQSSTRSNPPRRKKERIEESGCVSDGDESNSTIINSPVASESTNTTFDAERHEIDRDEEISVAAMHLSDAMDQINPNLGDITDLWRRTCQFFRCKEDIEDLKIRGIRKPVKSHQLLAAFRMLTQVNDTKIATLLLADQAGVGKTLEVIVTIVVFNQLWRALELVKNHRQDGNAKGSLHFPLGIDNQPGDMCGYQDQLPYSFQCPCNESSDSAAILRTVPCLPCIITAPASVMDDWVEQWDEFVDNRDVPKKGAISLAVVHEGTTPTWTEYYEANLRAITRAEPCDLAEDPQYRNSNRVASKLGQVKPPLSCKLKERLDSTSFAILVSERAHSKLMGMYKDENIVYRGPNPKSNGKSFGTNVLGASFMFFDEPHLYCGAYSGKETQALKLLASMRDQCRGPVVAVPISRFLQGWGPRFWRPWFAHGMKTAEAQGWPIDFGRVKDLRELRDYEQDYNYLAKILHTSKDGLGKDQAEILHKFRDILSTVLPKTMVARKQDDVFLGRKIVDTPKICSKNEMLALRDGSQKDAICHFTSILTSWMEKSLQEKVSQWKSGDQSKRKPTIEMIHQDFLQSEEQRQDLDNDTKNRAYFVLRRALVFPEVARVWRHGEIKPSFFKQHGLKVIFTKISQALCAGESYENIENLLRGSPWWDLRENLLASSPKIEFTMNYMETQLTRHRDKSAVTSFGEDFENVQHLVIFAELSLDAFLAFLVLYPKYHDMFDIMLLHPGVPTSATKRNPKHCRRFFRRWMSPPYYMPIARPKVLITSYEIGSVGLNLQRANHVIQLTEPRNPRIREQAIGHIWRLGQRQAKFASQLIYEDSFLETIRRQRNENWEELAKESGNTRKHDGTVDRPLENTEQRDNK